MSQTKRREYEFGEQNMSESNSFPDLLLYKQRDDYTRHNGLESFSGSSHTQQNTLFTDENVEYSCGSNYFPTGNTNNFNTFTGDFDHRGDGGYGGVLGNDNCLSDTKFDREFQYLLEASTRYYDGSTGENYASVGESSEKRNVGSNSDFRLGGFDAHSTTSSLIGMNIEDPPDHVFMGYEKLTFTLDAPNSIAQKVTDGALSYMNVGVMYNISGICNEENYNNDAPVRTLISLLIYGKGNHANNDQRWEAWKNAQVQAQSQAHVQNVTNANGGTSAPVRPQLRPLEANLELAKGLSNVREPILNGIEFTWIPNKGFTIPIRVFCLSTDFVTQKGVTGMPLKLQVDVLGNGQSNMSLFRSQCLIKVFRSKGAERKHKEESKNTEKRLLKYIKRSGPAFSVLTPSPFFPESKTTVFTSVSPLGPSPLSATEKKIPDQCNVMNISGEVNDIMSKIQFDVESSVSVRDKRRLASRTPDTADDVDEMRSNVSQSSGRQFSPPTEESSPLLKKKTSTREQYVTIYVKEEDELAYHAVYMYNKSIEEFKKKIALRYGRDAENFRKVYKRTKKGILVNVDSEMISRMEDETDFILTLKSDPDPNVETFYCILTPNFLAQTLMRSSAAQSTSSFNFSDIVVNKT
eukprot:CFRG1937T1